MTDIFANLALAQVLPALILLLIGILCIRFAMQLVEKALEKSRLEKAVHKLITSTARILLYALLALIVASKLGIDVTGIIALASVATLAISLALQNALANVFGGFVLLTTHPFHTGDFVEVAGQSGMVQEIGLTYTKLTTADNKLVSIPNSAVTSDRQLHRHRYPPDRHYCFRLLQRPYRRCAGSPAAGRRIRPHGSGREGSLRRREELRRQRHRVRTAGLVHRR